MRNTIATLVAAVALLWAAPAWAVELPERPDPPRLVNDLAGVLGDTQAMEDTLERVARETSNQIAVVTVTDLQGLEAWDYAVQLGRKWGVGGKEHNNGVVLLIKPSSGKGDGRVTIQVGYGLEGALPDGFCSTIVSNELTPQLAQGDYSGGVWRALRVIIPVVKGEYNERDYNEDRSGDDTAAVVFALGFFGLLCLIGWLESRERRRHPERYRNNRNNRTWGGGGPIIFGGGSGGSFGGGGFGGGFGGFGGGSFGGGGASGSF